MQALSLQLSWERGEEEKRLCFIEALLRLQKQKVYSPPLEGMGKFRGLSSINLYGPLGTVTSVLLSATSWPSPDKVGTVENKTETTYIISEDIFGVILSGEIGLLLRGNMGTAACLRTGCRRVGTGERRSCTHITPASACTSLCLQIANLRTL